MDHVSALVSADALVQLIGKRVRYQESEYRVADALPEEGVLVLVSEQSGDDSVQDDAYGRAHRIAPRTLRLRVRSASGKPTEHWHELFFL